MLLLKRRISRDWLWRRDRVLGDILVEFGDEATAFRDLDRRGGVGVYRKGNKTGKDRESSGFQKGES